MLLLDLKSQFMAVESISTWEEMTSDEWRRADSLRSIFALPVTYLLVVADSPVVYSNQRYFGSIQSLD